MEFTPIFFDSEFTGLTKDASLLSIGFVTLDSRYHFYVEFPWPLQWGPNEWMQNNVVANFSFRKETYQLQGIDGGHTMPPEPTDESIIEAGIFKSWFRPFFLHWLEMVNNTPFIFPDQRQFLFISDCAAWDWILFTDLITQGKSALDLPDQIHPAVYDINTDLHRIFGNGFEQDRAELVGMKKITKHNALEDAKVIRETYLWIQEYDKYKEI